MPGCIANGIDEQVANKIFDDMTDFAKYAFNKSHAAAYTIVSYQTAYLKYYYPVEFMAALMTSVIDYSDEGGRIYYGMPENGISRFFRRILMRAREISPYRAEISVMPCRRLKVWDVRSSRQYCQ